MDGHICETDVTYGNTVKSCYPGVFRFCFCGIPAIFIHSSVTVSTRNPVEVHLIKD